MTKLKGLHFAVVVLITLALVPVGAHLLALPNKIDLPQRDYFTVQAIYLGWWLPSGIILVSAIVTSLMLTILLRGSGTRFWLALAGFVLIASTLVIFFVWTQPANAATANWTVVPDDWQALRAQWEYSHATNAVVTLAALCAVLAAMLMDHGEHTAGRQLGGVNPPESAEGGHADGAGC
jgi:hypothetical protein